MTISSENVKKTFVSFLRRVFLWGGVLFLTNACADQRSFFDIPKEIPAIDESDLVVIKIPSKAKN